MATFSVEEKELVVRLTWLEKLGALHGDVRVALGAVVRTHVTTTPWAELRGFRAPGTGIPGVIMLGTLRGSFGRDFCAVYGRGAALVVELQGASFGRLVLTLADPQSALDRLRAAATSQT